MALERTYRLSCDSCRFRGPTRPTSKAARSAARTAGWRRMPKTRHTDPADVCPNSRCRELNPEAK